MSFLRVALATALISSSAALSASPPTGSRIDPVPGAVRSVDTAREDEIVRVMNQFARCVAKQRRARAEAILALPYLSPEQSAAVTRMVGGEEECLRVGNVELRFRAPAMIGGMAEQLVLDRFRVAEVERLGNFSEAEAEAAGLVPRNIAEDFGMCMVLRDGRIIYDLIATRPTSDQEADIIAQLAPRLGSCLVEGETLSLETRSVRSLLAVGLYRALSVLNPRN